MTAGAGWSRGFTTLQLSPTFHQPFDETRILVRDRNASLLCKGVFTFKTILVSCSDVGQRRVEEEIVFELGFARRIFFWQAFEVDVDDDFEIAIAAFLDDKWRRF